MTMATIFVWPCNKHRKEVAFLCDSKSKVRIEILQFTELVKLDHIKDGLTETCGKKNLPNQQKDKVKPVKQVQAKIKKV